MHHKIVSDSTAERRLAVNPELAGWSHLTFRTYYFAAGKQIPGESVDDEVCMMFLSGTATVTVRDHTWPIEREGAAGGGPPQCIYLPPQCSYLLNPRSACEVAYARWPAQGLFSPRFVTPETMEVEDCGSGPSAYRITHILRPGDAEHLVCAEIALPPGHWCEGAPLAGPAAEAGMALVPEKVCYYRLDPVSGWAIQRLYNPELTLDETFVLGHGDAVLVRDGLHPVVASPRCRATVIQVGAVA